MKSRLEIVGMIVLLAGALLAGLSYARSLATLQRAAAAEQFAQNIIDSAPWPMVVCDASAKVVIWNKACETFTGWPREVMLNQPVNRIIPANKQYDHATASDRAAKSLSESDQQWTPTKQRKITVLCRDGREVETTLMLRGVKSGNRIMFIAAFQPIVTSEVVEQLKAGQSDRWKRSDTLQWLEEFGRLNPGVKLPDIDKIGK